VSERAAERPERILEAIRGTSLRAAPFAVRPPEMDWGGKHATSPTGPESDEQALREAYLYFLTRLSKAYLLVPRAASAALGRNFDENAWEGFARDYDLPVASTFARASA
jgi:hypothetical protein